MCLRTAKTSNDYCAVLSLAFRSEKMTQRIAVVGAGSWGTALAIVAARAGHDVTLWSRDADIVKSINEQRVNSRYLTSEWFPIVLSPPTPSAQHWTGRHWSCSLLHHTRRPGNLLIEMSAALDDAAIIVSVSKGIEIETGKRISEIAKDVLGSSRAFVCLSGPSFAKEVVAGQPTAIVKERRRSRRRPRGATGSEF